MEIKTGYLYHIKDEFFHLIKDKNLMANHKNGGKRPAYFALRENDILWFIPLSSQIEKYQKIIELKEKKYGRCVTIIIRNIIGKKHAILLQNAFPTLEKYIDHVHIVNNSYAKVSYNLEKEITRNFKIMLNLKKRGINLFFTDVDKIKEEIIESIKIYH